MGHQQNLIEASGRVKSGGSLFSVLVEARLVPMRLEGPTTPPHTHSQFHPGSVLKPQTSAHSGKDAAMGKHSVCCFLVVFLNTGFGSEFFFFFFWFRSISVKCKSQSQQWEDKSKTVRGMKARLRPTPLHKFLEKNTCFAPTCPEIAGCTCERLPTK